jgi:hypothetical protein
MRVKNGIKLLSMVGTVLAAGALAASPMIASAADGDVDVAVFVGATTQLTPVHVSGGSGTFTFTSSVCVGLSSDTVPPEVGTCAISATGGYNNVVCGTGNASGTANITEPDGSATSASFGIIFVAGVGIISPVATPLGGGGEAVGVVDLQPTSNGLPDTNQCVNSFEVEGVAVVQ